MQSEIISFKAAADLWKSFNNFVIWSLPAAPMAVLWKFTNFLRSRPLIKVKVRDLHDYISWKIAQWQPSLLSTTFLPGRHFETSNRPRFHSNKVPTFVSFSCYPRWRQVGLRAEVKNRSVHLALPWPPLLQASEKDL